MTLTFEMPRRAGRTTRLLQEAARLAKLGRAVYVVAATKRHAILMERQLEALVGKDYMMLGVKFETASALPELDWDTLALRGAHPNCEVLVDHHAIESRYFRVLEMLHRFDCDAQS